MRTRLHSSTHTHIQPMASETHFEHSASLNKNLFLESLIFLFIISFCYYRSLQWRKLNSEIDSSTTIFQQRPRQRRRRHAVYVYFEKLEYNWICTHFMFEKCRLETEILYFGHKIRVSVGRERRRDGEDIYCIDQRMQVVIIQEFIDWCVEQIMNFVHGYGHELHLDLWRGGVVCIA